MELEVEDLQAELSDEHWLSIADHAPERSWRHLDTMQFETARYERRRPERTVRTAA